MLPAYRKFSFSCFRGLPAYRTFSCFRGCRHTLGRPERVGHSSFLFGWFPRRTGPRVLRLLQFPIPTMPTYSNAPDADSFSVCYGSLVWYYLPMVTATDVFVLVSVVTCTGTTVAFLVYFSKWKIPYGSGRNLKFSALFTEMRTT